MRFRNLAAVAVAASLAVYAGVEIAEACRGTPKPSCQQTIWLSKYVPETVVYPGAGVDIIVPIGLVPYLKWTDHPACADPVSLDLDLTLTCTPVGGGAPVTIGPLDVPLAAPPVQCIQTVLTMPGGAAAPFNIYEFVIPGGTLPPGDYTCLVEGTFSATFAGGNGTITNTGAGTISAMGDTEVCIVEPAPGGDPSVPRLDLELLRPDGLEKYQICRRGDQSCNYYLLTNNDLNQTVAVTFNTGTTQVAGLPTTDSPGTTGIHAISGPAGTDAFPQQFADFQLDPLIPEADPEAQTDAAIERTITLPPHGVHIFAVNIRSFGACADGSCCDVLAKAFGTYEDGSEVVACAGTSFIVGDAPGKSPLCEYVVQLKTGSNYVTACTSVVFDGDPHHSVFKSGNVPPYGDEFDLTPRRRNPNDLRMQVIGTNRQVPQSFAQGPFQQEYVRLEHAANTATYRIAQFDQNNGRTNNWVTVTGLREFQGELTLPFFLEPDRPSSTLRVFFDLERQTLRVQRKQGRGFRTLHTEPFDGFSPPTLGSRLFTQPGGCITIICDGIPNAVDPIVDPPAFAELFNQTSVADLGARFQLVDRLGLGTFSWSATSSDGTVTPSGSAGAPVDLSIPNGDIARVPGTTLGWIDFSISGNTLRDTVYTPYAARVGPVRPNPSVLDVLRLRINGTYADSRRALRRNRVSLISRIRVGDGFDPTDKLVVARVNGWAFPFRLNKRGRGTALTVDGARAILRVVARRRRGQVFEQDARIIFSTRGGRLLNGLAPIVPNVTVPRPGELRNVPVEVFFCGEVYDADLNMLLRAIENRSYNLNGPQGDN